MTQWPIARRVLEHAQAQPRRVAVRCGERVRRYGELARDVEAAARGWRSTCRPAPGTGFDSFGADAWTGAVVAIELPDPLDALIAVLAAELVGATPLVCDPEWDGALRSSVLAPIAPAARVSVTPMTIQPAPDAAPHPARSAAAPEHRWAGFTSGSTGRPRAVVRSATSWTGSYDAVSRLTGTTEADTVLVPGPLSSSLYAFAALHTLASGATLELLPRRSPRSFAQSLPEADIVHVVPHTLDVVVDRIAGAGRGRLRTAVVGGAALAEPKREKAAAAGMDVVAYYGASELSFVAVDPDGAGLRAFPGVTIDVRTGPGDVGEVWVRSPWVAHGYLAGASGPLHRDDDGWATVGDLAERYRPGEPLRLRGRADGAVTTGGATVVPEDVESVLAAVPGVSGVVVVGTPHERLGQVLTAVVEGVGRTAVRRSVLESASRAGLAPAQRPRRWFAVDTLPRTSAGKPARAAVRDAVSAGRTSMRPLR